MSRKSEVLEQRVIDLQKQGASYEEIEEAKMDLVKSFFEVLLEGNTVEVSIEELKRMEAAGESTDNVLVDANEFMQALNAGEFD